MRSRLEVIAFRSRLAQEAKLEKHADTNHFPQTAAPAPQAPAYQSASGLLAPSCVVADEVCIVMWDGRASELG